MPVGGPAFSSVRKARELLREKSEEILNFYLNLASQAAAKEDFETAEKIYWKLLEHTNDDDGSSIVAPSVDKPKQIEQKTGPTVNIGFQLGGVSASQPTLPEPSIDVISVKVEDEPRNQDN